MIKHVISNTGKAPEVIRGARAVSIGSVVYVFGGRLEVESMMGANSILWKLTRISEGYFVWDNIATTDNMKAPSPRCNHSAWNYCGNLWTFGGYGSSPVGYLNNNGDFVDNSNNQLLCFNPSFNEWTNPKCSGSVPTPRSNHATAISEHTVWLYGGQDMDLTNSPFDELF